MAKYYAVKIGRKPGIYDSWEECKAQVSGYPNASYKGFDNLEEAKAYRDGRRVRLVAAEYDDERGEEPESAQLSFDFGFNPRACEGREMIRMGKTEPDFTKSESLREGVVLISSEIAEYPDQPAYRRGTVYVDGSFDKGVYGFGGFVVDNDLRLHTFSGCGRDACAMRNVTGELNAAMHAVELAITLGLKQISIHYDYSGVEMWALEEWKANKQFTKEYVAFMKSKARDINISFHKVQGHTNEWGNELADRLAGEGTAYGLRKLNDIYREREPARKKFGLNDLMEQKRMESISDKLESAGRELDEIFGR